MGKTYKMNAITGELDLVENLEEINAALEMGILKSVDISGENMIFTFNTPDLAPVTVPLSHFATNLQGHAYIGLATPSTTPVTLKGNEKVFYIAVEEGDYSNFGLGNINELSVIKSKNGSWKIEGLGVPLNLFMEVEEEMSLDNSLAGIYDATATTKKFISLDTFKTVDYSVTEGEKYRINSYIGGVQSAQVIFWDSTNTKISVINQGVTSQVETTFVIPDNAVEMSVCGKTSKTFTLSKIVKIPTDFNEIKENSQNALQKSEEALQKSESALDIIDDIVVQKSKNLYDGRYIDRGYISNTGSLAYADGWAVTEPIPVQANHYYYLSKRHYSVTASIRCLTADGEVLKVLAAKTGATLNNFYLPEEDGSDQAFTGQFKTPEGAVSVQFIIKSPGTSVNNWNDVMLEDVGDVYNPTFKPSPYQPYELKTYIKEDALPEKVIENITGQNKRKAPRILLIGSSHGMNTISQVPWMFYRNGYDEVYIGNVYIGSFMIQELAQRIALGQSLSYQAFKNGAWGKDKGNLTMNDLLNKEWDIIVMQRSANTCQKWGVAESTSFGYVVDYITRYIKETKLKTPRILFNSGFSDGSARTTESIMNTALMAKNEYGVEIIPNAYAMANARNTWLKEIGTTGYLCYDNQHLDYGIGCWLAGATLYEAVMRPLGESIECVSGYGTQEEQYVFTAAATAACYTEPTEKMIRVAKDCVLSAFNADELNNELEEKYKYKNQVRVFPGWANIEGIDANTKCIPDNGTYSITFSIWSGSYIDDSVSQPVIVKMGDTDITASSYVVNDDNRGGIINISNVTDDVVIIIRTTRDDPSNHPA